MKIPPLRDHQQRDYQLLTEALRSYRSVVLSACTGYGKTRVAGELALDARKRGERVLFLAPWRELIPQTCARFQELGIRSVGVMMAGYAPDPAAQIIVGTIETVRRWAGEFPELEDIDYVIADEAHGYGTDLRRELLDRWGDRKLIGLTGTPFRADSGGLGDIFEHLVQATQALELMQKGFLVWPVFFSTDPRSLQSFKLMPGSPHDTGFLGKKPKQAQMVGDIIQEWEKHGVGKTLCFANSVAESEELAERWQQLGYTAEHIDSGTPDDVRTSILARFAAGETQIVCNHAILCEGYDLPDLETVILKRTNALRTYLQMVGRGIRAAPGKTECVILDPAGLVFKFGFPQDYRHFTLDRAPKAMPLAVPVIPETATTGGPEQRDESSAAAEQGSGPSEKDHRMENPAHVRKGAVHVRGSLSRVDQLPDDATSVMRRLEDQALSSGYGMPWAVAEFRRQFGGAVPAGKRYRQEAEAYYRRQAEAAGLPAKWAKERMRALFS